MLTDLDLPRVPFTKNHAHDQLGITRRTLRRLEKERMVRRITSGVYVAADVEDSIEVRARGYALVVRPHQIICDRSAGALWGVETYSFAELDDPPLEICALRGNDP